MPADLRSAGLPMNAPLPSTARVGGANGTGAGRAASAVAGGETPLTAAAPQVPLRLNLGCGDDLRPGYVNVDAYNPRADSRMSVLALEVAGGTVEEIFSSHMLEHLGKFDVPKALQEWHRALRPGGRLVLDVPDLEWMLRRWLETPEDGRWGFPLDCIYGMQTEAGQFHRTGFTATRITALLREAGFVQIAVRARWSHGVQSLWVEAEKAGAEGMESPPGMVEEEVAEFAAASDLVTAGRLEEGIRRLEGLVERAPLSPILNNLGCGYAAAGRTTEAEAALRRAIEADGENPEPRANLAALLGGRRGEAGPRPPQVELAFTGERLVPDKPELDPLYQEHMARYLFAAEFLRGRRVLDAGCGCGYGAYALATRGAARVVGVDRAPEAIAYCLDRYAAPGLAFFPADVTALPFGAGRFDGAASFEVIEHLSDPEGYLAEIARALTPDGILVVSTPNKAVYKPGGADGRNPFHVREFTVPEFRAHLERHFGHVRLFGEFPQATLHGVAIWPEAGEGSGHVEWVPPLGGTGRPRPGPRPVEEATYVVAVCERAAPARRVEDDAGVRLYLPSSPQGRARATQKPRQADREPGKAEALARSGHGLRLLAEGQTAAGLAALEAAAAVGGKDPVVLNNLGCGYAMVGRIAEAEATLHRAVAADATFREARANLADLYRSQGQWDKAMQQYRIAMELFPNDAEAREGLEACLRYGGHPATVRSPASGEGEALERVPCILCGRTQPVVIYDEQPAALVRCPGCDLVFYDPQPTEEALRAHYRVPDASLQAVAAHPAPRMESKREILDLIQGYASPPAALLDVGCANGEFLAVARERGWEVTGFEASPVSAAFARTTFGLRVEEGVSLAEAGFPAGSFDVVTLQHVLEHQPDPRGTLHEVRRILRPGGLLWVMVPNYASLLAQELGPRWEWKAYPNHLYYFTPETLRALAEATGFTLVEAGSRTGDANRGVYAEVLRQRFGDEDAENQAARMRALDRELKGPELLMALRAMPADAPAGAAGASAAQAATAGGPLAALVEAGAEHLAAGRAEEAAEAFRAVLAVAPELGEVRGALGSALLGLGRMAEALAELTAAAESLGTTEAWNNLGCAYAVARRVEEARAAFLKAIALDGTNLEPQRNLASLFESLGMPAEAAAAYDLLLLTAPGDAEALAGKARCAAAGTGGAAGRSVDLGGAPNAPRRPEPAGSISRGRGSAPLAALMDPADYQRRIESEKAIYAREYRKPKSRETLTEETSPALAEILRRARELERAGTGEADFWEYVQAAAARRIAPRILSLGSGPGGAELDLARKLGPGATIDCIEINDELIALGRARAAAEGLNVRFARQDVNALRLEAGAYDLIMVHAALHHFVALEHIFDEVHRALTPDGEFVVNEVIARNGLRLWPETKAVIGHLWSLLPERFRVNHALYDRPRVDQEYPDRDYQGDGFECVRSQDILPLLREGFQVMHCVPYFGFSRRFFDRMHGLNYDLSRPLDRAILEFIWQLDCELVRAGQVRAEVAFLVLRRKRS